VKFHQEKLKDRIQKEKREEDDINLITDSILSLSRGYLV